MLPLALGGQHGVWMNSLGEMGNDPPARGVAGLLFSVPLFLVSAIAFRMFFNWHSR